MFALGIAPDICSLSRQPPVFPVQRFMQQHLKIRLIPKSSLFSEKTRARNVGGVDPNRNRRSWTGFPPLLKNSSEIGCAAIGDSLIKPAGSLVPVIEPPLSFFGLGLEFGKLNFVLFHSR